MSYLDSSVFGSRTLPFSSSFITTAFEGQTDSSSKNSIKETDGCLDHTSVQLGWQILEIRAILSTQTTGYVWEKWGKSDEVNGDDTNKGECLHQNGNVKEKADEQVRWTKTATQTKVFQIGCGFLSALWLIKLWPNVFQTSRPPTLSRLLSHGCPIWTPWLPEAPGGLEGLKMSLLGLY